MKKSAFAKKVAAFAEKNGAKAELDSRYKIETYVIAVESYDELERIAAAARRVKSFHVETWAPYSPNYFDGCVKIFDAVEYEQFKKSQELKRALTDRFFEVLRDSGSQEEAKRAQYALALEIGAEKELAEIYA